MINPRQAFPGFWCCINRFASGLHWDRWLRWGPGVWVVQMASSRFTIETWGQSLTTECFPQFHRFVHPEVVYHRHVKLLIISHNFFVLDGSSRFCLLLWRDHREDAFPMGAQDTDLVLRVKMLGNGHHKKVCLGSWTMDTIWRFAKRTLFNKDLLVEPLESSFSTCALLTVGPQLHF